MCIEMFFSRLEKKNALLIVILSYNFTIHFFCNRKKYIKGRKDIYI